MLRIGTCGWQYRSWRGLFYPPRVPQRRWLEHYAEAFSAVEVDSAFYRLPRAESVEAWAAGTPEDFLFAMKASRYLTHVLRLRSPEEPVSRLMAVATRLGPKLGPILVQLPPDFRCDEASMTGLDRTLAHLAPARVAVELRHDSWWSRETEALLRSRGAALCLADRDSRPVTPLWATAPWGYLRLHEGGGARRPCYGPRALRSWLGRLGELWPAAAELFVFFNNDPRGCAVHDAQQLGRMAARLGMATGRFPEATLRAAEPGDP